MDTKKLIRTLDAISYETKLGKNLKNTLRKVDKDLLMDELNDYRLFLKKRRRLLDQYTYRIKSLQSIKLKYDRYYPTKEIGTCFNDILGIRIIVLDYDINLSNENIRHVDMSNGKKNDDGYRGYHITLRRGIFIIQLKYSFLQKEIISLICGYINTFINIKTI